MVEKCRAPEPRKTLDFQCLWFIFQRDTAFMCFWAAGAQEIELKVLKPLEPNAVMHLLQRLFDGSHLSVYRSDQSGLKPEPVLGPGI